MPGNEETITRDAKPIQTTETAVQQVFQSTWKPMTETELQNYADTRNLLTQEFIDKYNHRQEQLAFPANRMTEVQEPPQTVAPGQAPTQPALSEKDQKKLRKELNNKKKAGKKLTPEATCYTTDLMAQMKEYVTGRDDSQGLINEAVSAFQSRQEASKREERTRMFGSLLLFAPQTKLDPETKHITPDSLQEQKDFLNQCTNNPETVIEDIRQKMFSRTFNPEKYKPDYVGAHFREIHEEQQQLKGFVALFREGTPEYEALTPFEKAKVRILGDIYTKSDQAFRSALEANGLQYTDYGLIPMPPKATVSLQDRRDNPHDVEELRRSTESMDDRQKQFLDEESERVIHAVSENHKNAFDKLRENMEKDDRTSFITSKRLSESYQYETIRDAKELIEKYPDQYLVNKDLIDTLINEIQNLMEAVSINSIRIQNINAACQEDTMVEDEHVRNALQAKLQITSIKKDNLVFRTYCIMDGLKSLLEKKPMEDIYAQILSEYGYTDPDYADKVLSTAEYANAYANNYQERERLFNNHVESYDPKNKSNYTPVEKDLCLMLMQLNGSELNQYLHTTEVIQCIQSSAMLSSLAKEDSKEVDIPASSRAISIQAKNLIVPYIDRIQEFDVLKWSQLSDEDLASRVEELMDIALPGMTILNLGQYADPDDPSISIRDALIKKEDRAFFTLKCNLTQGYMMKARALAMIAAYKNGTLTQDSLLPSEYSEATDKKSGQITEDSLLAFAKQQYIKGDNLITGERNRLIDDPYIFDYFNKNMWMTEISYKTEHTNFLKTQTDVSDYLNELRDKMIDGNEKAPSTALLARSESIQLRAQIANLQQKMTETTDEKEREDMTNKVRELQDRIEQFEIYSALTASYFRLAGENHVILKEALFRSWDSVDSLPAFQSMSDEEFHNMCRLLAAGGFHFKDDTPEQTAGYREQNREGLMIYKEHMSTHYHQLEAKYHHKIPPLEYRVSHFSEIKSEFANIQIDSNLVDNASDMIDMNAPEDVELYHLVLYYATFGTCLINNTIAPIIDRKMYGQVHLSNEEIQKQLEGQIQSVSADSYAYLQQKFR